MSTYNNTSLIYWLGGSTCAGKTIISNILSKEYGFTVYHCDEYMKWTIGLFNEEFKMILEDLWKLSADKPILVEGVGLFPELVSNEICDINHAVWLVADEIFYKKHQMKRIELFERLKECSNPEHALQNYINYDLAMGRYIINDAKRLGLSIIEVGNDSDILKNAKAISSGFKLN